jgi:erythromycin esterase-like protein
MRFLFVLPILFAACTSTKTSPPGVLSLPVGFLNVEKFSSEISPYFEGKKIIQLGEAIHMTRELPLARLYLLPALAQQHFDLILFEGSTIEAWLAADLLLKNRSSNESELANARDIAFPGIWRTAEYTQVLKWLQSSWRTPNPIYLASYDLQPGMGSLKEQALPNFLGSLEGYVSAPGQSSTHLQALSLLSDRKNGFPNSPLDSTTKIKIETSIDWLERWIAAAEPIVSQKYPFVPHGRILRQIPAQLRRQTELWLKHSQDTKKAQFLVFQETRDRLAAQAIVDFTDLVSQKQKSIVWAHHVHVFHNVLGKARHSLGHDLKDKLGDKIYTIGSFVGSGESYSLDLEEAQPSTVKEVEANSLEGILLKLASKDFFVDFKTLNNTALNVETTTSVEGIGKRHTVPTKDFDAAIFVHKVSRPKPFWEK